MTTTPNVLTAGENQEGERMKVLRTLLIIGLAANAALYARKAVSADNAYKCQKPDGSIVYRWQPCDPATTDVGAKADMKASAKPTKSPCWYAKVGKPLPDQGPKGEEMEGPSKINERVGRHGSTYQYVYGSRVVADCYIYLNNDLVVTSIQR